ncbi:MAG: hypothetical protein R3B36_25505 [Polyangiaceae bacterium]
MSVCACLVAMGCGLETSAPDAPAEREVRAPHALVRETSSGAINVAVFDAPVSCEAWPGGTFSNASPARGVRWGLGITLVRAWAVGPRPADDLRFEAAWADGQGAWVPRVWTNAASFGPTASAADRPSVEILSPLGAPGSTARLYLRARVESREDAQAPSRVESVDDEVTATVCARR